MTLLEKWAEETIDLVTPFAEELNKDFYPLQSPAVPGCHPAVLFLGLNPGGGYDYESQKKNTAWEFKDGKMTVQRLLKGNPSFENQALEWPLLKGLKRIGRFKEILDKGDFVLANYYYLSTPDFKEVQSNLHKEALTLCKQQTLKLINILNPGLIIVLGTSAGIDQLPFSDKKTVLSGYNQRLIVSARSENSKVYAIPHPSTMAITQEEADAIDQNMRELFKDETLTKYNFIKINYDEISIDALNQKLKEVGIGLQFKEDKKDEYSSNLPYKNSRLILKILNKKNEKYFCIRDADAGNKGQIDRYYKNLESPEMITDCIADPKSVRMNGWLIQKFFKMYGANSLENFYHLLIEDMGSLYKSIR